MKRDPAAASVAALVEDTVTVPAALHFNMIDRILDLSGGRIEFKIDGPVPAPAQPSRRLVELPEIGAEYEGGLFAGVTLHLDQRMALILLAGERTEADWQSATEWAQQAGGELPSRIDGLVLFENAEKLGFAKEWYWTAAPYAGDAGYAWVQYFDDGTQTCSHTSYEYRCRAVRRVPIQ